MITNFKIFEDICRPIKSGDYIVATVLSPSSDTTEKIFKVISFKGVDEMLVNKTDSFDNRIFVIQNYQVKYWSENKEDLEAFLMSKKYNL